MKRKNVSIKNINLKDERFRISYHFFLEKMVNSLEKIGLINPPSVCVRNRHFILVSGWKRVLACLKLSLSPIPVFISDEEDDLKIFLYALHENLATRNFTLIEKAEIIHKLKKFGVRKNSIIIDYLPLFDIPPLPSYYEDYLAFAQFEPELKKAVHEKNMPFYSLKILSKYSPEARHLLLPILSHLSQNKQKEILEELQEISLRENTEIEEILKAGEIKRIQGSEKISSLEKAEKIRTWMKKRRYPHLTSWENSFDSTLRRMHWPEEIAIKHSPFFEDENITVSFAFRNKEEFGKNVLKLQEMASKKEFSKIFK